MSPDLVVVDIGDPSPAPSSDACDTTLVEVIDQTRRLILTGRREERNRLTSTISAGAASLDLDFPAGGIKTGTRITIDLEHFYVWNVTGTTVTVDSAQDGSTAAGHTAGAIIRVNPVASDFDIMRACNDTLRELSSPGSGLFAVFAVDLTYDPNILGYDLTAVENLEGVLDVQYPEPSQQKRWIRVPQRQYRLQRDASTTDFASGLNLTFFNRFHANQGAVIRVIYKSRYSPLATYTDNVELVAGLHCDAHDLLWIGSAIRLSDSREIERNNMVSQGEPRRASEVPPGSQNAAPTGLLRRWQQRMTSEASRLSRRWPTYIR